MNQWRCKICGYIHTGDRPPEVCPVCGSGAEEFEPAEKSAPASENPAPAASARMVIIGNGPAGMEAARAIRQKNRDASITVFSDEPYLFYSRIHLSTFIADNSEPEHLFIYPPEWYREQNIGMRLDTPVRRIVPERRQVIDGNGDVHDYDRLIITTGAHPFLPPIQGTGKEGVFTLRTLQDALRIRDYRQKCRTVVVLGGGILGIEAANSLAKTGLGVTVVEMAERLMPRQLDYSGAEVLQNILKTRGIDIRVDRKALEITGHQGTEGVRLNSGETIAADMVLISAGITANMELAESAGIEVNRGIVVDEYLQTNRPHIYAAGDVAEFQDRIYGIWPAAVEQGAAAGLNALGIPTRYRGTLPLHILKVAGLELTSIGQKFRESSDEQEIIFEDRHDGQYVKLIHDGEHLRGAIVLGVSGIGFRLKKILERGESIRDLLPDLSEGNWDVLKKRRKK